MPLNNENNVLINTIKNEFSTTPLTAGDVDVDVDDEVKLFCIREPNTVMTPNYK